MTKKTKIVLITTVIVIILLVGLYIVQNKQSTGIKTGDSVMIEYEAKLNDGRIFESTDAQPRNIIIGENTIPGLDKNLIGLYSGDIASFSIPASAGYAKYYDPNKVQNIPIYTLQEAGILAKENTSILLGTQMTTIRSIQGDMVTLDNNPAHTRQDLEYTVQIIGINQ